MYRHIMIGFSFSVIALSLFSMVNPQDAITVLINPEPVWFVLRSVFAILLIVYGLVPAFRFNIFRESLLFLSVGTMLFLFSSLFSDGTTFPGPIDLFFGVQGSLYCLIAYLDLAQPKSAQKFIPKITAFDLLLTKIKSVPVPGLPSQRKTA